MAMLRLRTILGTLSRSSWTVVMKTMQSLLHLKIKIQHITYRDCQASVDLST